MVLAGLMKTDVAAALVFDMHNEYGFDDRDTDREVAVRGLKSMFGSYAQIAALGKGARVRGHTPDFTLELATSDFTTTDINLLGETLNLTDTAAVTLGALDRAFGEQWFARFMKLEPGAVVTDDEGKTVPAPNSVARWARDYNIHEKAAESLHRRLALIYNKPYVVERPAADGAVGAGDGHDLEPRMVGQDVYKRQLEHHSNDLPWRPRAHVVHVRTLPDGRLDEDDFDRQLAARCV